MIEAIEVLPKTIHSIVSMPNSIRVQHWDDQKIELISEPGSLNVISD